MTVPKSEKIGRDLYEDQGKTGYNGLQTQAWSDKRLSDYDAMPKNLSHTLAWRFQGKEWTRLPPDFNFAKRTFFCSRGYKNYLLGPSGSKVTAKNVFFTPAFSKSWDDDVIHGSTLFQLSLSRDQPSK